MPPNMIMGDMQQQQQAQPARLRYLRNQSFDNSLAPNAAVSVLPVGSLPKRTFSDNNLTALEEKSMNKPHGL